MKESKKGTRRKDFIRKLRHKYRLVIINDATFDERLSILLTPLNVITIAGLAFFLVAGITISIIVITPLKEYIPGYSDAQARKYAFEAAQKADSLSYKLAVQHEYLNNLKMILSGKVDSDTTATAHAPREYDSLNFAPSHADSALRREIESQEAYALSFDTHPAKTSGMAGVFFFSPLHGMVTSSFDPGKGHFGVDVTSKKDAPIQCVLDGTVIFSSFTTDAGYVIAVQHDHNLISVYKHNSVLLKKVGDRVSAGDIVAIIGETGELADGPHLHFELWQGGKPLDPQEYIAFQ